MEIRSLKAEDSSQIARLHLLSFSGFFLSSLGERFLQSFYKAILLSNNGLGAGVFESNNLVSFAIGTNRPKNFYFNLLKTHGLEFLFFSFWNLLLNPLIGFKLVKNLTSEGPKFKILDGVLLLSICSDPAYWGSGYSSKVISKFENIALKSSYSKVYLTTDFDKNERANFFYIKLGYHVIESFVTSDNRKMNLYLKELK